jgi:type I restriction enzyme S subunit
MARYCGSQYYKKGKMSTFIEVNPSNNVASLSGSDLVSFVPMANVQSNTNQVTYETVEYKDVSTGFTVFKRGDLLWAKITPCMQNGKSCIVSDMPTEMGFGSTEFHVIRKRSNDVYMPFIWAIFSNQSVLKAAQSVFGGSAGQQRVSADFIKQFPAVLPDYKIQVELAEKLEKDLEQFKAKLRKADALLAGMDEYVRKKIGLPSEINNRPMCFATRVSQKGRFDPEFYNPFYQRRVARIKAMKYDTLGNIIEFSSETWDQSSDFVDMFPYIEISGVGLKSNEYRITPTPIAEAPSRAKMVVRDKDIIMSMTRPHRGAIATIACDDGYYVASTGFCVLRKLKRKDVTREYLQWVLLNEYILQQFLQRSSGGNYPAIIQDEIKKALIPIPDESIQREIVVEAGSRKIAARALRAKAETEWAAAKARFERELLARGGE